MCRCLWYVMGMLKCVYIFIRKKHIELSSFILEGIASPEAIVYTCSGSGRKIISSVALAVWGNFCSSEIDWISLYTFFFFFFFLHSKLYRYIYLMPVGWHCQKVQWFLGNDLLVILTEPSAFVICYIVQFIFHNGLMRSNWCEKENYTGNRKKLMYP